MFKRIKKDRSKHYLIKLLNNSWIRVPKKKLKKRFLIVLPRNTPKMAKIRFNPFFLNKVYSRTSNSDNFISSFSERTHKRKYLNSNSRRNRRRRKQLEVIVID
jgi:hypothetical protein